jgi:FMN phosphatase YigB (HAD superfamily)
MPICYVSVTAQSPSGTAPCGRLLLRGGPHGAELRCRHVRVHRGVCRRWRTPRPTRRAAGSLRAAASDRVPDLPRAAHRRGAAFLPESLARWKPFPDTNRALERLRDAGYALGILSNLDDDLLAGTLRHFTVPFEFTVTAQQVRSYKPALRHFRAAREHVAGRRWLHAAQSYVHDVAPCAQLGISVAWVNRKTETAPARPQLEFRDLTELADWLA